MSETLEWARAVWNRRRWLAILAFALPLTIGLTLVAGMPNIYRATVTVLVDRQQIPESLVAPTVTSALETRLKTISQEILSRPRLEALRAQFGLYPDLVGRVSSEHIADRLRSNIRLELRGVDVKGQNPATVAFSLSYQGTDPRTVARVANTLASFYIEENVKARERQASGTAEFLRVQLGDTKKRLDQQEHTVSEFKRRYLGELPQQMEPNLATLERLQMQIRLNLDGQTRAQERRNFLRAEMSEVGTSGGVVAAGPSGALETPHSRLARLKNDLRELRTRYSDKYPDIVALEAEIAQLMREQAEAKAAAPKSDPQTLPAAGSSPLASRLRESLTEAETELKVLKAEEARLRASVATYQARVERIPQREQELKDLARDYETTREFYQSLLKRHDEAQIAESMEQRQKSELFRVIDPAAVPTSPITNRLRLVVMIAVLCVGLGAAAAVLAEQMDTSFHTRDQIRSHTSVPLLVSIPRIVTEADAAASRMRFRLSTVAVVVAVVAVGCLSYYMAQGNEQLVWILSRGRS